MAFRHAMGWLLLGGIAVRLAVFIAASPFTPDQHYEVIQYIAFHGYLPLSNVLGQSYHPPLYYLLMTPLELMWRNPGPIHFLSFVISTANLLLIRRALEHPLVMPHRGGRIIAFSLVCFLPQFVMFSSFVSNDTLAFLTGTLIFIAALRYITIPSLMSLLFLGAMTGVGLLTKGTFLLTGPALALLVGIVESRHGWRRTINAVVGFGILFAAVGSYKYVENFAYFGRPIVHNLDGSGEVYDIHRGTWKGPQTLYDINVMKLIRRPVLKIRDTFSYPLLMYGTFWYPHVPDSSFRGNVYGCQWVGSLIYTAAIVPTLIFLMGLARAAWLSLGAIVARSTWDRRTLVLIAALLLLLSNVAVVVGAGVKYDVWMCFQSRLCFQSMVPMAVLLGAGMELLPSVRWARAIVNTLGGIAIACCILYFIVEIALTYGLFPPGPELLP